jgi:uncharacterized heparinase superfamily protein
VNHHGEGASPAKRRHSDVPYARMIADGLTRADVKGRNRREIPLLPISVLGYDNEIGVHIERREELRRERMALKGADQRSSRERLTMDQSEIDASAAVLDHRGEVVARSRGGVSSRSPYGPNASAEMGPVR